MLAAVVLVWVGRELPESLGYTCLSMEGVRTARLVLIYETSSRNFVPWSCFDIDSVVTHEVCQGCVASMHTDRIEEAGFETGGSSGLRRVLEIAPQVLAELKPTWGHVFARLLSNYTHWTYTDADVVFGDLDSHLLARRDDDSVDVETWSFEGDAARVFLRGQFALHKNDDRVNQLWRHCSHLSTRFQENVFYKLDFFLNRRNKRLERMATDARRKPFDPGSCQPSLAKFISAEACYSCVVFRQSHHLTKRIVPAMLTDHDHRPVTWTLAASLCRRGDDCLPAFAATARSSPLRIGRIIDDCYDMQWICRSTRSAGLRVEETASSLGRDEAAEIVGRNVTIYRYQLNRRALFHFRKWADYGKFETGKFPTAPTQGTRRRRPVERAARRGFVVEETGIHPMF